MTLRLVHASCDLPEWQTVKLTSFPLWSLNFGCEKNWDGDIRTCVGTWDLGTRDEGLEDTKYGTQGCQKQERRGHGMCMIIGKVGGKCDISFFKKNVLFMVNIRFHLPKPPWTPYDVYTKHFFIIGVSVIRVRVDFHCRVIFPCVRACVKFTSANKIEVMYERSHVSIKVESRSTSRLIATVYILPLSYLGD